MFRPEPLDIVIILVVALLLFGTNRLPETARSMGRAMHEFREALSGKEPEPLTPKPSDAAAETQNRDT